LFVTGTAAGATILHTFGKGKRGRCSLRGYEGNLRKIWLLSIRIVLALVGEKREQRCLAKSAQQEWYLNDTAEQKTW